ncbi:MAG: glycosyltransferase family 4 protein [Snowella sp.]|nr:glycosyltransferase family 4 protein [Snowella sp.]
MKPIIWHLIGDKRAGGSNHLVGQLVASCLSDRFQFSVLRLEAVKAQLKIEKPDLIIFHYPCAWKYVLTLLSLKFKAPLWICDHHYCQGFEADQVKSKFRFRWLLKIAYAIADGVISVSQAQRQWMINSRLAKSNKIKTITPASKIESLLKISPKTLEQPLILGAYGRFARQKGFENLLAVMEQLPPEQFQLRLGGYGPDEQIIQQLAARLPQVQLVGTIANIADFLADCDAVIIPSRWEPFGLVCLEAKAAGKAVIVSAVDGLPEQVDHCGLVVPFGDQSAWKTAIAALPEQDLLTWGKQGKETVINAWENCLKNWENFLTAATRDKSM